MIKSSGQSHIESWFGGISVLSRSGRAFKESPIKKRPGVRVDRLYGYEDRGVKRREFKIDSTRINTVFNSLKVNEALLNVQYRCDFNDFMAASQSPTKCGDLGGIKFH